MSDVKIAGAPARDEKKVQELHMLKFDAWTRLRDARSEMKRIDTQMISAGATVAELEHLCW